MRLRRRTARREALRLLRQNTAFRRLQRPDFRRWLGDNCDWVIGWVALALTAFWFAGLRHILPRLPLIPAGWDLRATSELVQFWTLIATAFLGLLVPLTILAAHLLRDRSELQLAPGRSGWRRPVELIVYVLLVLTTFSAIAAAARLAPESVDLLWDALSVGPVLVLILLVRVLFFVIRVFRLLDADHVSALIDAAIRRLVNYSLSREVVERVANGLVARECEKAELTYGHGMTYEHPGFVSHPARRTGVVRDLDLDAIVALGRAATRSAHRLAATGRLAVVVTPMIGRELVAGETAIAELPEGAANLARLRALADRIVIYTTRKARDRSLVDARPALEALKHRASTAIAEADDPEFERWMGAFTRLVQHLSELFEEAGLLLSPEQVREPFSAFRPVFLLARGLRDLGREVVRCGRESLVEMFEYDLSRMLRSTVRHADLSMFAELVNIHTAVHYWGLEARSTIARHRARNGVRDILEDCLYPELAEWRDVGEDRVEHLRRLAAMVDEALDALGRMSVQAVESGDVDELGHVSSHLAEIAGGRLFVPIAPHETSALCVGSDSGTRG
jgi:hypothetical protein